MCWLDRLLSVSDSWELGFPSVNSMLRYFTDSVLKQLHVSYPSSPPDPVTYLSLGGQMSAAMPEVSFKELQLPPNNGESNCVQTPPCQITLCCMQSQTHFMGGFCFQSLLDYTFRCHLEQTMAYVRWVQPHFNIWHINWHRHHHIPGKHHWCTCISFYFCF